MPDQYFKEKFVYLYMASAWEIEMPQFNKLEKELETDVCIIGGGLAGIWCAYLLSKGGKKVVVLECDKVGRGATLYTTAFITQVIDTPLIKLNSMFGTQKAKAVWQSGSDAIDQIEKVIQEEGINCEFLRLPLHLYASSDKDLKSLEEEAHLASKLGFETEILREPLVGFKNFGALRIENQAKYHPMKFFKGLVQGAVKEGAQIFENSEALEINEEVPYVVKTKNAQVKAPYIISAAYEPFNNPSNLRLKKGMYISYVYELSLEKNSLPEGMYIDTANPYHYVRVDNLEDEQRMIVGGEDHRAEITFEDKKSFRALEEYIHETFPQLKFQIRNKWQGGILEPSDGLALIGEFASQLYVASAFSGNGMTYSALAGMLISDAILGKKNSYGDLYDPKRLEPKALAHKALDYAEEFFGGAVKNLFK